MSKANAEKRSLAGQVAVVTGSTQGIGGGIALKLAEAGARILVHGRESQRAGGEKIVAGHRGRRKPGAAGDRRFAG